MLRILVFLFLTFFKTSVSIKQFQVFNEMTYSPCDPSTNLNLDKTFIFNGSTVFSNEPNELLSFTIAGWINLRGLDFQYYNIVTVTQGGNSLFQVEYRPTYFGLPWPSPAGLYATLLGVKNNIPTMPSPIGGWYFVEFTVLKSNNNYVSISTFYKNFNTQFTKNQQGIWPVLFNPTQLTFYFGVAGSTFSYAGCVLYQYMTIYWIDINESSQYQAFSLTYDTSMLDSLYIWNYDFFYTQSNPGYAISVIQPMGKLSILDTISFNLNYLILKDSNQYMTDYINSFEQGGFILSFHFMLTQTAPILPSSILLLNFNSPQIAGQLQLTIQSGKLVLGNNLLTINGIQLNQWYQVTFIMKMISTSYLAYLQVNNDPTMKDSNLNFNLFPQFNYGQFIFGGTTGVSISLAYVRHYKGAFIGDSDPACYLKNSRANQSCIICAVGNFIDYQNNEQCISSIGQTDTFVTNVKDWFPKQFVCGDIDMIVDKKTGACVCRFQFYRDGDQCYQCPDYCQGCTDATTCILMDANRQLDGTCPSGYFDDGYTCIIPSFNIISRLNYYQVTYSLPVSMLGCTAILQTGTGTVAYPQLNIIQNQGFFFAFSFQSFIQKHYSTIAYLKNSTLEQFTIMFGLNGTQDTSSAILYVDFVVAQQYHLKRFVIDYGTSSWVGIWTDFKDAVFYVQTNGQLLSSQVYDVSSSLAIPTNPNSMILCVGECPSALDSSTICGTYGVIQIIYNMVKPLKNRQIENLLSYKTNSLGSYIVNFQDTSSPKSINIILTYNFSPVIVDRFKGFLFQNSNSATFSTTISSQVPTIICNLFIEKLTYQLRLFSIGLSPSNTQYLEYLLIPYGTRVLIRLCFYTTHSFICQDTKYAMLNMNQSNSLAIIYRQRSNSASTNLPIYQQFEIICNQQRESMEFAYNFQVDSFVLFSLFDSQSGLLNFGNYAVYLNNIIIHEGNNSYYLDENPSEPCFLYFNAYNMQCTILKKGYLFYYKNGVQQIITTSQCLALSDSSNSLHVIDYSTQTCYDTGQPNCVEIYNLKSDIRCSLCKYINADINNSCLCPDGTFLNISILTCEKCSPICSTCKGSFDNCTSCLYVDQSPPTCNCSPPGYFLDSNSQCSPCSNKCYSCDQSANSCTSCSPGRVEAPDCNCDDIYEEVGGVCLPIICDSQCSTCIKSSSNCVTCSTYRATPPTCGCDVGYILDSHGNCVPCSSGYYYETLSKDCQPCQLPCKECVSKKDNCTLCIQGLILEVNSCYCPSGYSVSVIGNAYSCLENMDVSLKVTLSNSKYFLQYEFDSGIQELSSTYKANISSLILVYFQEIPQSYYSISNPQISGNKLSVQLNIFKSFQSLSGKTLFYNNTPIVSVSYRYMLDPIYVVKPLSFELGPFVFNEQTLSSGNLDSIVDQLKSYNAMSNKLIQRFQLILYLVNTAQPTLLYLLLKAQLPPNLYKFYQVFGILVYPDVVDYESHNYKDQFDFYFLNLNTTEVTQSENTIYKKLGFSNSFLINAQGIVSKYLVYLILIVGVHFAIQQHKYSQNLGRIGKLISAYQLILQKVNAENDTDLLLVTVSIFVQYINFGQSDWAVRDGFYLSLSFMLFFCFSFYVNFKEINIKKYYYQEDYSYQFTERVLYIKDIFSRNYFLIQLFKKYFLIMVLFIFRDYPSLSCSVNGITLIISLSLTIILKPYKTKLTRFLKMIGEIILAVVWFLHIWILFIEKQFYNQTILDEKLISKYLNLGFTVIILLIIFNLLYVIELLRSLIQTIKDLLNKKGKDLEVKQQRDSKSLSIAYHLPFDAISHPMTEDSLPTDILHDNELFAHKKVSKNRKKHHLKKSQLQDYKNN